MIRVSRLSKSFNNQPLFSGVDLTIGPKERIGLIGRNGSGKSTFLKILLEQESYDSGSIEKAKSVRITALQQHLEFGEPTVLAQVTKALPKEAQHEDWKAKSVLMGLGFTEADFDRPPSEFSSGMQVRIRLAEVLVSESQLLLLDEPTNYLDILSLRWMERFLTTWPGAFVLVTHDQSFMERVVTHTVGIHRGKMRKIKGGVQKLLDQIAKEEEIHETTRVNQEKKDAKTEEFIRKFRSGARSAGLVQSRIKALEKQEKPEKLTKLAQISFQFQALEFNGGTLFEATNICFGYEPTRQLISKFSLRMRPGERVAVIGRNGKGKSTLLKLLVGDLEHQSGKIKYHSDVHIGYFAAGETGALDPSNTILGELMALPDVTERQVRSVCGALLFSGDSVKKKIEHLSGGEKSRVCFAKVLLSPTNLLVLDEPTNHLDMESCRALTRALDEFAGTVLFVTHDETMLSALATRLVVFERDGIKLMEKTYDDFLQDIGWEEEVDTVNAKKLKPASSHKEKYLERKHIQKELRKVQKEQAALEKALAELEAKQTENAALLQQSYEGSDRDSMAKLGKEAKDLAEQIANGYAELDTLMENEAEIVAMLG